jgi:hypothetical protein
LSRWASKVSSGSRVPSTEQPVRITSIGWASADAFQHFLQRLRQVAQALELALVVGQFGLGRQLAVQQQVGDFLELAPAARSRMS